MVFGNIHAPILNTVVKYTAKDYVQNGLIAMWDGIENTGWGVHDASATVWKDLMGMANITLHNAQIYSDHIYFPQVNGYGEAAFPQSYGAIEVVLSKNVRTNNSAYYSNIICIGTTYSGYGLCAPRGFLTDTYDVETAPYVSISDGELFSATLNKSGPSTIAIAKNGAMGADGELASGSRYASGSNSINGSSTSTRNSDLWIRSIRLYSHVLTAEEIAANYAVDKARFNLPRCDVIAR